MTKDGICTLKGFRNDTSSRSRNVPRASQKSNISGVFLSGEGSINNVYFFDTIFQYLKGEFEAGYPNIFQAAIHFQTRQDS